MTKFKTLIGAVAIASAMALVGCANPTNTKTTLPTVTPPSLDNIEAPLGGSGNNKDKFAGKKFTIIKEGNYNEFIFSNEGTIEEKNNNVICATHKYKISDKDIYIQPITIKAMGDELLNFDQLVAKNIENVLKDKEGEQYQAALKMAGGDSAKVEEYLKYSTSMMVAESFAIRHYTFEFKDSSYELTYVYPEINNLPKDMQLFFNFSCEAFESKYSLDNSSAQTPSAWENNKVPLIDVASKEPVTGTWSKDPTKKGNEQVIKITISPNESYDFTLNQENLKSMNMKLTEVVSNNK